ncbi:MAG: sortase [bacterium]|nr:sortase [bacterium]
MQTIINFKKLSFAVKLTVVYTLTTVFILSPSIVADYRNETAAKNIVESLELNSSNEIKKDPVILNIGNPTEIYFARGTKTLSVSEGVFDSTSQTWIVKNGVVEWIKAQNIVTDSNIGHTILYGHNNTRVLGLTKKLVVGDFVVLKHQNSELIYEYVNDEIVDPSNLSVLSSEKKNTLTLITCHGRNNEQRRLMHFNFKGIK